MIRICSLLKRIISHKVSTSYGEGVFLEMLLSVGVAGGTVVFVGGGTEVFVGGGGALVGGILVGTGICGG
jgi:hypothetical protein